MLRRIVPVADDGFTLLEAVVSFVLLSILSAAAISAIVAATKAAGASSYRVTAANLVQQDLEDARGLQYPNYPTAAAAHKITVGNESFTLQRTVTATCPALWTPGQPTSMTVTTKVSWPGSTATVTEATVIAC